MTKTIDATLADLNIHHATKAKARRLQATFEADYPVLTLSFVPLAGDDSRVDYWVVEYDIHDEHAGEYDENALRTYDAGVKVPELQDVLAFFDEQGLDPELGFEEGPSGSIVDDHYRVQYREVSTTKRCNGDWLAEWLAEQTLSGKLELQMETLEAIFSANGLDLTAPWARAAETQSRGWQGRYRMNGRQVLERVVALNGYVKDAAGEQVKVPAPDLAILRGKHAKWIAKQEKATKEAVGVE